MDTNISMDNFIIFHEVLTSLSAMAHQGQLWCNNIDAVAVNITNNLDAIVPLLRLHAAPQINQITPQPMALRPAVCDASTQYLDTDVSMNKPVCVVTPMGFREQCNRNISTASPVPGPSRIQDSPVPGPSSTENDTNTNGDDNHRDLYSYSPASSNFSYDSREMVASDGELESDNAQSDVYVLSD